MYKLFIGMAMQAGLVALFLYDGSVRITLPQQMAAAAIFLALAVIFWVVENTTQKPRRSYDAEIYNNEIRDSLRRRRR